MGVGFAAIDALTIAASIRPVALIQPTAVSGERSKAAAASRAPLAASAVALAPAAMTALLQAQEHTGEAGQSAARAQSAQQIDHLISRLSDCPPPPAPQTQPGTGQGASVSMTLLLAARQHLRQAWA